MKKINCIMLVDDNPADNEYHTISIEEAKVCNVVKIAEDATEALDYLNKCAQQDNAELYPRPDLIFLDINMPAMNGFEFLKEYNKIAWQFPDTQVIMLSTSDSSTDKTNSVRAFDISDYVTKPLTEETVRRLVEKYF